MPIRQALLEPLALSAFGHEGVVNGRVAVSEEKKQRPYTQLRIRAFCPGIFAFLAVFRVVEKKRTDLSDGFVRPVTY